MKICHSPTALYQEISALHTKIQSELFIILIGGCSRSGKSTLAKELATLFNDSGRVTTVLNIDSWLVGVDKRKPNSKVFERYDVPEICTSVENLVSGKTIFPPLYDVISRKRLEYSSDNPIKIQTGILVIEGVISLSIEQLLNKSNLNVFVDVPDFTRLKRLIDFYERVKKLTKTEYKTLILDREKEEVPFIKNSAKNANIIFH